MTLYLEKKMVGHMMVHRKMMNEAVSYVSLCSVDAAWSLSACLDCPGTCCKSLYHTLARKVHRNKQTHEYHTTHTLAAVVKSNLQTKPPHLPPQPRLHGAHGTHGAAEVHGSHGHSTSPMSGWPVGVLWNLPSIFCSSETWSLNLYVYVIHIGMHIRR